MSLPQADPLSSDAAQKQPCSLPITALTKWPGGKRQELKYILPRLPRFHRGFDPFVGGGSLFFAMGGRISHINDASTELIELYRKVAANDEAFFQSLERFVECWTQLGSFVDEHASQILKLYQHYTVTTDQEEQRELIATLITEHGKFFRALAYPTLPQDRLQDTILEEISFQLSRKMARMKALEDARKKFPDDDRLANLECALKSSYYNHIRHLYNHRDTYKLMPSEAAAAFFLIRELVYSSMFRYNGQGHHNAPYGGLSYNRKDLAKKMVGLRTQQVQALLRATVIENTDFEEFLRRHKPNEEDFLFLDPPYETAFSTYAQHPFGAQDHHRLAQYLFAECRARFMLMVKDTPLMQTLYSPSNRCHIVRIEKMYQVSFQGRNCRETSHLIITNFVS